MPERLEAAREAPRSHGELPAREAPPLEEADAHHELVAIASRIDRLEERAAVALAAVNDAKHWRRLGYTSATAFLKHQAGWSAGRARNLVWRANSLREMPLTLAAYASGELSTDQVDALSSAHGTDADAFARDEEALVSIATQLPCLDELWRILEYWKREVAPDDADEIKHDLDSLRGIRGRKEGHLGRVYACLSIDEYESFMNLLDPGPPVPEDHRSLVQRRADALVHIVDEKMDRPQLVVHVDASQPMVHGDAAQPMVHTDAPQLVLHADATAAPRTDPHEALHLRFGTRRAETDGGAVLAPGVFDRHACDATVCRIVFGPSSQVIDAGRSARLFSTAQKRAIAARDRRCRFPGCDREPRWCDYHHIRHWLRGGPTSVENGILLCRFHHTMVHEPGWELTGTVDLIEVRDDLDRLHGTSQPSPVLVRGP